MKILKYVLVTVAAIAAAVTLGLAFLFWSSLTPEQQETIIPTRQAEAPPAPRQESRSDGSDPDQSSSAVAVADDAPCTISKVSDGDTVNCEDGRRIRLLLIDTPERSQKPYGDRARNELAKLLPVGTESRVELDVRPRDRYGRTLAYLYTPEGKMANREMVRRGYAVVLTYPPNVKHVDAMQSALASAKKAKRGLWSTPAFECEPRDYRAQRC